MPQLAHFSRNDDLETIFAGLDRDGGVIIDDFLTPEIVDALAADFTADLEGSPWGNVHEDDRSEAMDAFFGYRTKRLHGLIGRSSIFEQALTDPFALACAQRLLGAHCKRVILSTGELMAIGPGERQQALHRDGDTWQYVPRPRPELLASFNVALTDFTEDNGATVVVPGSHTWDRERRARPDETARAVMEKGSALLYVGEVIHSGGANASDATRIGMYFGYIPSWLRPLENSYVTVTEPVMRGLGPVARELVGYTETGFQLIV